MIKDTLFIFGPGGVGKSPLDYIIRDDIIRIDPFRLRKSGPRDTNDIYYANPKLKDEIYNTFRSLDTRGRYLSENVLWYSRARTLFIRVREDWQILFLSHPYTFRAKAEIYSPLLPILFDNKKIRDCFGQIHLILLNPGYNLNNIKAIKEKTGENCKKRGDKDDSIKKRVKSIDEEIESWNILMDKFGALEFNNWRFSEYKYTASNKLELLKQARACLIDGDSQLEIFLKTDDEIK